MTAYDLREFSKEVAAAFEAKKIHAPVHLCGGNEKQLLGIFQDVKRTDWVFSTWRSYYHALLRGVPRDKVMAEILAGRSMMLHFPEYRFFTSAIVGGILPIACGMAYAGERVWCFVGDMTESIGAFADARHFASGHDLDVNFIVEDNGLATNTPTRRVWGPKPLNYPYKRYEYQRTTPHVGLDTFVQF